MTEKVVSKQVEDEPELLELMLKDFESAPEAYHPSVYWSAYEKKLVPELKTQGLRDFRRRKDTALEAFGGTDNYPIDNVLSLRKYGGRSPLARWGIYPCNKLRLFKRTLRLLLHLKSFRNSIAQTSFYYYDITLKQKQLLDYQLAKYYGLVNNAKPISNISASAVGNPNNVFYVEGKLYVDSLIRYYLMYAYCCKFVNFDSIETVMEIGSGRGGQIEVLKKLHPHLTFFVFDIPPQLYVCEQYLKALFPDSLISYRETREMKTLPSKPEGKIFILPPWILPKIENLSYDLFWNSVSFQEMNPPTVSHYLKFVNQQTKKFVFLHAGKVGDVYYDGKRTILKAVGIDHYDKWLSNFERIDCSPSMVQTRGAEFLNFMIWKRVSKIDDKRGEN